MAKTSSYRDSLLQSLADPTEAIAYLNAGLEDSPEAFLKALKNVSQAKQMKKVAEAAGVKRETLYRSLSEKGNPTLGTLTGVLSALGLKMFISSDADDVQNDTSTNTQNEVVETGVIIQTKYIVVSQPASKYGMQSQEFGSLETCTESIAEHFEPIWNQGDFHATVQ